MHSLSSLAYYALWNPDKAGKVTYFSVRRHFLRLNYTNRVLLTYRIYCYLNKNIFWKELYLYLIHILMQFSNHKTILVELVLWAIKVASKL